MLDGSHLDVYKSASLKFAKDRLGVLQQIHIWQKCTPLYFKEKKDTAHQNLIATEIHYALGLLLYTRGLEACTVINGTMNSDLDKGFFLQDYISAAVYHLKLRRG